MIRLPLEINCRLLLNNKTIIIESSLIAFVTINQTKKAVKLNLVGTLKRQSRNKGVTSHCGARNWVSRYYEWRRHFRRVFTCAFY